jgi:hypothetical protein
MSDWQPWTRPLAVNIPIVAEEIRLDFPAGRYLTAPPVALVCVHGPSNEHTISSPPEAVAGLGEVHTHVVLTFPAGSVGQQVSVWVAGT